MNPKLFSPKKTTKRIYTNYQALAQKPVGPNRTNSLIKVVGCTPNNAQSPRVEFHYNQIKEPWAPQNKPTPIFITKIGPQMVHKKAQWPNPNAGPNQTKPMQLNPPPTMWIGWPHVKLNHPVKPCAGFTPKPCAKITKTKQAHNTVKKDWQSKLVPWLTHVVRW